MTGPQLLGWMLAIAFMLIVFGACDLLAEPPLPNDR